MQSLTHTSCKFTQILKLLPYLLVRKFQKFRNFLCPNWTSPLPVILVILFLHNLNITMPWIFATSYFFFYQTVHCTIKLLQIKIGLQNIIISRHYESYRPSTPKCTSEWGQNVNRSNTLSIYIYIKLLISTYLNIDFNVSVFSRGNIIFFSLVRKACA